MKQIIFLTAYAICALFLCGGVKAKEAVEAKKSSSYISPACAVCYQMKGRGYSNWESCAQKHCGGGQTCEKYKGTCYSKFYYGYWKKAKNQRLPMDQRRAWVKRQIYKLIDPRSSAQRQCDDACSQAAFHNNQPSMAISPGDEDVCDEHETIQRQGQLCDMPVKSKEACRQFAANEGVEFVGKLPPNYNDRTPKGCWHSNGQQIQEGVYFSETGSKHLTAVSDSMICCKTKKLFRPADYCSYERDAKNEIFVFPAIPVDKSNSRKKCLQTNLKRFFEAYCGFVDFVQKDIYDFLRININVREEHWPGIQSLLVRDARCNLKDLDLPADDLYQRLVGILRRGGDFDSGLKMTLEQLRSKSQESKVVDLKAKIDFLLDEPSFCGPKIFVSPKDQKTEMCQLFHPYSHHLSLLKDEMQRLFGSEAASFLDMTRSMNRHFLVRQQQNLLPGPESLGKSFRIKTKGSGNSQCQFVLAPEDKSRSIVQSWKNDLCQGYKHLDLSGKDVKNFAMRYLHHEMDSKHITEFMGMKQHLKYLVDDKCDSQYIFKPNDISVQYISLPINSDKEAVGIAELDSTTDGGYLKSGIPNCAVDIKDPNFKLPYTKVEVEVFMDWSKGNCCGKDRDRGTCNEFCTDRDGKEKKTNKIVKPVKRKGRGGHNLIYTIRIRGTTYSFSTGGEVLNTWSRRRRLLNRNKGRC
jgi:hypothetical protein